MRAAAEHDRAAVEQGRKEQDLLDHRLSAMKAAGGAGGSTNGGDSSMGDDKVMVADHGRVIVRIMTVGAAVRKSHQTRGTATKGGNGSGPVGPPPEGPLGGDPSDHRDHWSTASPCDQQYKTNRQSAWTIFHTKIKGRSRYSENRDVYDLRNAGLGTFKSFYRFRRPIEEFRDIHTMEYIWLLQWAYLLWHGTVKE